MVFMLLCENPVGSSFQKKKGRTRTIMGIRIFPKKTLWFSSLVIFNNLRTTGFFGWFSQAGFQKFDFFFGNFFLFFGQNFFFEHIFRNL